MPLNRLEDMYARDGVELARSTMCGWHGALAEIAKPLVSAMRADAFKQPYLCVDATGVLVQQKERCRTGHFWVVVAPGRHVLFEYTRDHSSDAVDDVLAGYEGFLVADAHVVYDHLYATGDVVEANCWAHYPESIVIRRRIPRPHDFQRRSFFGRQVTIAAVASLGGHVRLHRLGARPRCLESEWSHGRYLTTNMKLKRDALGAFWRRAGLTRKRASRWRPTSDLLAFLSSL